MSDNKEFDYSGESYEAQVPDTLDLAHRAELAMHGIAGAVDPDDDYLMWFRIHWNTSPPYMEHAGAADMECTPKVYDAMTLLRQICGSREYLDTEHGMETALLSWLNKDDGLYDLAYSPKRPWHMEYYPGAQTKKEDYACPVSSGIMLTALVLRNELGLTPCEDQIRALVRGLDKAAIKKDDYAYYPVGGETAHNFSFPRSSGWEDTSEAANDHEGGEGAVTFYQSYQIRGLAMWAARSGDKQALELAGKLVRYAMKPRFWENSADPIHVVGGEQGHVNSHFHARMAVLRGLLEYGIVAKDTHVCDFVRSSYEYMRSYGINRIGYIPSCFLEALWMEGCMLGDFLALTVKMSRAGIGDYWDDADRIIRNHLAEAQYTRPDLLEKIARNNPQPLPEVHPGQICTENVHERMLGVFASHLMPTHVESQPVIQCCTGNATRGIAYAWDGILDAQGDEARVNLLLNRASKWLDIDSYLPYEGKVVIHNKTARQISVRIPAWVDRSNLQAQVNGTSRNLSWVGTYVVFDNMKPGDKLQLDFPVTEETVHLTALTDKDKKEYTTYKIVFRGNTVVDISPRNESPDVYPMYLREHMKNDKAPMKTKTRFVSDKTILNW